MFSDISSDGEEVLSKERIVREERSEGAKANLLMGFSSSEEEEEEDEGQSIEMSRIVARKRKLQSIEERRRQEKRRKEDDLREKQLETKNSVVNEEERNPFVWPKLKRNQIYQDLGPSTLPLVLSRNQDGVVELSSNYARYLTDYQKTGVKWIFKRLEKCRGCILNDDMGLGKTIQIVGLLAALYGKSGRYSDREATMARIKKLLDGFSEKGPLKAEIRAQFPFSSLIICPKTLFTTWGDALERWGSFIVVKIEKAQLLEDFDIRKDITRGIPEVVLLSYDTFLSKSDFLHPKNWQCVVLDECHVLSSNKKRVYEEIKKLKCQRRVGLTGTAIQNNLEELFNIIDIIRPGYFGELKDFRANYTKDIMNGLNKQKNLEAAGEKIASLVKALQLIILRRDKRLLRDLMPQKIEKLIVCEMTNLQKKCYRRLLAMPEAKVILDRDEPCDCGRRGKKRGKCCHRSCDGILWRVYHEKHGFKECARCPTCLVLPFQSLMTKIANHPSLIYVDLGEDLRDVVDRSGLEMTASKELKQELFKGILGEDVELGKLESCLANQTKISGKIRTLAELLPKWTKAGTQGKVLIFSISKKMLKLIGDFCTTLGIAFLQLDGTMSQKKRDNVLECFDHESSVRLLLMTIQAGGVGLNLTVANRVIIFDPTWNPVLERQAMDRAFRLGQRIDVEVYRLLSKNSIEEKVNRHQNRKHKLVTIFQDRQIRNIESSVPEDDGGINELLVWKGGSSGASNCSYEIKQDGSQPNLPTHEGKSELEDLLDFSRGNVSDSESEGAETISNTGTEEEEQHEDESEFKHGETIFTEQPANLSMTRNNFSDEVETPQERASHHFRKTDQNSSSTSSPSQSCSTNTISNEESRRRNRLKRRHHFISEPENM